MLSYVLKGIIIGLTVSIPVGPVGLLCLDMTVTHGRKAGVSCALGMVTADIFSAGIMLLGISMMYAFINAHALGIKIVTGIFFSILGIILYLTRKRETKSPDLKSLAGVSLSAFLLSVSPATFALMIFLFPALNLTQDNIVPLILLGVALGSACWCSIIIGAGGFIRKWLGEKIAKFKGTVGVVFVLMGLSAVVYAGVSALAG